MTATTLSPRVRHSIAVLAFTGAFVARWVTDDYFRDRNPFLTFQLAIIVAGWFGGGIAAAYVTIASFLAADYAFIEPRGALAISLPAARISAAIFVGTGMIGAFVFGSLHRSMRRADELIAAAQARERQLEQRIAERDIAEARLRDQQHRFAAFMNSSTAVAWMKDEMGVYAYVNQPFATRFCRPAEQWVGMTDADVWPEVAAKLRANDRAVLEAGTAVEFEEDVPTPDGAQHNWLVYKFPFVDGSGQRFTGGMAFDITDLRKAEQQRRQLEAQIQQAQKLESLGILAGGIAHDFNNLLMGILGHASLALEDLSPVSPARESVRQIEIAALRAADLTRQMLAYSGKGKFVVEAINLSELVEEMIHLLRVSISKSVTLKTNLPRELPAIEADASQVRQVVMNLITNASDAIGERNGVIGIVTGTVEADRAYLAESFLDDDLPDGLYVSIEVTDTGTGMDEETKAKVFDPFFTTKMTGRGLGMAAVLGIVRGHKGAIRCYSEPGRGTTFKVLFPAATGPRALARPPDDETLDATGSGTILVVDDDPAIRLVAQRILGRLGYEVLLAEDGRQGVEFYRARREEIAAVLLDMTMPTMNGEEAYRELRRVNPAVRVLLTSGYSESDATDRFVGKGLAGFIQKPYRPRELAEKLHAILHEQPT